MMRKSKFLIGIDEAGRGPLAGPVAVGVVKVSRDFDWGLVPEVGDSKQLSEQKREAIYKIAWRLRQAGKLDFAVAMSSSPLIDQKGIVSAVTAAMQRGLRQLSRKRSPVNWRSFAADCEVRLDGGLKAPAIFEHQQTIIKGDQKEKVIGLASIMAKVTRDRYMRRRAKLAALAPYDFHIHKGYGTRAHRTAIATHGLSPEHRRTYCKKLTKR